MKASAFAVALTVAVGTARMADELPERHRRVQDALRGGRAVVVPGDPGGRDRPELRVVAGCDAVEQRVDLRWIATSRWTQTMRDQRVAVGYHPLAVVSEAPLDDVLYVIGWDAEENASLAERWTFSARRPEVVERNGLGEPVHAFDFPERVVDEIARWPGRRVYEAVFHPAARELWMLCDATPDGTRRELVALDVDASGEPVSQFDRDEIPSIDTASWLQIGMTADGGRVHVFVMPAFEPTFGGPSPDHLRTHVLVDADRDGTFEESWSDRVDVVARKMAAVGWTRDHRADPPVDAR